MSMTFPASRQVSHRSAAARHGSTRAAPALVTALAPALTMALATTLAGVAQAMDIRWSASDTFSHMASIAPGKALEACGSIEPRLPVDWRFSANGPLTFDIHRHSGNEVIYASRSFLTREQNGRFSPTFQHEWCWMWSNESEAPVTVQIELKR